ncbi:MAG: MATE family efflux transporter [Pseudomonadota bacterium]
MAFATRRAHVSIFASWEGRRYGGRDLLTQKKAKFLEGDLMRHTVVMSASASVGLISIFLVDFVDLYFISLLGKKELAAAVGFAGTLLFAAMSVNIGLMIAMGALGARRIGAGDEEEARRIATSVMALGGAIGIVIAAAYFIYAPQLLELIGASGETRDLAARYMRIIAPVMPISVFAMIGSGLLRAHGDARRAMNTTLSAGIVNAILDPILIFGLGLGLDGAAYASAAARVAMFLTAIYPILKHYGGFAPFHIARFVRDLTPIFAIAGPAILTNVATPIGAGIVTRALAPYGDAVVAGFAVISRLTPLAFCVLFALSGAVGPIIGQNFGANQYDRVRQTLIKALQFAGAYTLIAWAILFFASGYINTAFGLDGEGGRLVFWFAAMVAPLFFFNGALFVSNAAFNNLNRPIWSTFLNWGRNTIGIAPFVWVGADLFGAPGVIIGQALGGIAFALLGVWLAFRLIDAFESGRADPEKGWKIRIFRPNTPSPYADSE